MQQITPTRVHYGPPLFTHLPSQTVWSLIKENPITLSSPFTGETRRPTRITFGRDYERLGEPK